MPKLSGVFIAAAALLWGTVAMSVRVHVDWHLLLIAGPGGAACLVLAGVGWMLRETFERILRDRVVRYLADTVAVSQRAALAVTVPLRAVR